MLYSIPSLSIHSKQLRFEQYTSSRLLAQFDEDLQQVHKISMRINTGNVIGPRYKIRLLRIRFTPLERPERSETRLAKFGHFDDLLISMTDDRIEIIVLQDQILSSA